MKGLVFKDTPGNRNLDTPFAAFIGGLRLQFNQVATEKYHLTNNVNFYLAVDRTDKLNRAIYLFPIHIEDNKTFTIQSARFPYIECPELWDYFKNRENIYFLIDRFTYGSLEGFRLSRVLKD